MRLGLLLPLLLLAFSWSQAQLAIPPSPRDYVSDWADQLTDAQEQSLNARLKALEDSTTVQLLVIIGNSLEGANIDQWANETFNAWKLGQAGKNNGILVAIFMDDRLMRIELGVGLEADLTDVEANNVIEYVIAPQLKAGNVYLAVDDAITELGNMAQGAEISEGFVPKEPGFWLRLAQIIERSLVEFWPLFVYFVQLAFALIAFPIHLYNNARGEQWWLVVVMSPFALFLMVIPIAGVFMAWLMMKKGAWESSGSGGGYTTYSSTTSSYNSYSSSYSSTSSGSGSSGSFGGGGGGYSGGGGSSGSW